MLDAIINDTISSVSNAFNGADVATLVLFGISSILVGIRCNSFSHIFDHALEALLITGLLYSIYTIAVPNAPDSLNGWSRAAGGQWDTLMGFSVQRVLGYYLLMTVCITAVFAVRRVLTRR